VAYAQPNGKILIAGLDSSFNRLVLYRLNLITSQGTRIADYNRDDKTDFGVFNPGNGASSYRFLSSDGNQFNLRLHPELSPNLANTRMRTDSFGETRLFTG